VEDARRAIAARPRHLRSLPPTAVPEGLPDLSAKTCGACHRAIYEEWKISTHAQAYEGDPQFLAELEKSRKQGVAWMCMNCHTPNDAQLPRLVADFEDGRLDAPIFVDNPDFDPALQKEAITCATCHVRDGVVLGPYGDTRAPHPVREAAELRASSTCTQCHQAQARFDTLGLVCVFDTGAEHAESPSAARGETCQSCHMPKVERPLAVGAETVRETRRHWFAGALIPKRPDMAEAVAALEPHFPPGLEVTALDAPARLAPGATARLRVEVKNARAGHRLPTGDPERFLTVRLEARGPGGARLGEEAARIGSVWEWHPSPRLVSDNRLAPGETRSYALEVPAPEAGPLRFRVEIGRWRISQENLAYHDLEGKTVPGHVFFEAEREVEVR
jgi:hypothetical protein